MLRKTNSIVLRTSLLFALLTAAVVLLMGIVVRISVDKHFAEMDRLQIEGKMELIQHILAEENDTDVQSNIQRKLTEALVGHHGLLVKVSKNGVTVFSNNPKIMIDSFAMDSLDMNQEWSTSGTNHRGIQLITRDGYHILVAVDVSHHQQFLHQFEWQLLEIGCCGALAMAILGWFAARRGLKPIQNMAHITAEVSAQQLHKRLSLEKLPVELHTLAHSFNAMLDRLEDSLKRLAEFSSDIAHELRTPISNLMTQTQVSLSKPRTLEEYQEILYSNSDEYERLSRMISDMLFLAKSDHGLVMPHVEAIDLKQKFNALCDYYEAVAAEKSVQLLVHGSATIHGDKLMLQRAFGNLIANAIRYCHSSSNITIDIKPTTNHVGITIENHGDTINEEQLPRLFDRFYRADPARQKNDEGAGLGLAITQSIINAHGGTIAVSSKEGITQFSIVLIK